MSDESASSSSGSSCTAASTCPGTLATEAELAATSSPAVVPPLQKQETLMTIEVEEDAKSTCELGGKPEHPDAEKEGKEEKQETKEQDKEKESKEGKENGASTNGMTGTNGTNGHTTKEDKEERFLPRDEMRQKLKVYILFLVARFGETRADEFVDAVISRFAGGKVLRDTLDLQIDAALGERLDDAVTIDYVHEMLLGCLDPSKETNGGKATDASTGESVKVDQEKGPEQGSELQQQPQTKSGKRKTKRCSSEPAPESAKHLRVEEPASAGDPVASVAWTKASSAPLPS